MGVIKGTMGGIFRNVLCNEQPVVFSNSFYATVSWVGPLIVYRLTLFTYRYNALSYIASDSSIFVSKLLAIYYNIGLPKFRFKS